MFAALQVLILVALSSISFSFALSTDRQLKPLLPDGRKLCTQVYGSFTVVDICETIPVLSAAFFETKAPPHHVADQITFPNSTPLTASGHRITAGIVPRGCPPDSILKIRR